MLIGYNLLSKSEQANNLAVTRLKEAGCQTIYTERDVAFSSLARGDTLVIPRLKVLAKSRLLFIQTFILLEKKGVHLQSLSENLFFPRNSMVTQSWDLIDQIFPPKKKLKASKSSKNEQKEQGRPSTEEDTLKLIKILKKDLRMFKKNPPEPNIAKVCRVAGICRQTYYNYFPKQA